MFLGKVLDAERWSAGNYTYFGWVLGFLPSTIQTWPPVLHRLHVLSPFGKSHFICHPNTDEDIVKSEVVDAV